MEKTKIIEPQDIPKLATQTCLRCGHTWQNRTENPRECPKCKSPSWNKPRKKIKKCKNKTLTCQRCGNTWIPQTEHPKACPKCHSPCWNKPRKKDVKQ